VLGGGLDGAPGDAAESDRSLGHRVDVVAGLARELVEQLMQL
jgi:hypothetical protein